MLDGSSKLPSENVRLEASSNLVALQIPNVPIRLSLRPACFQSRSELMGRVDLGHRIETVMLFSTGNLPLVRASATSKSLVRLPFTSLVAKLNSANAVWASTPPVVAPALQPPGTADQKCTRKTSSRPSPSVVTVGNFTDWILGPTKPDPKNPDR